MPTCDPPIQDALIDEIFAERLVQISLWGDDHDDRHSHNDWVAILTRHIGMAAGDGSPQGVCRTDGRPVAGHDPERFRRQMVRVAAIALAALEAEHRKAEKQAIQGAE